MRLKVQVIIESESGEAEMRVPTTSSRNSVNGIPADIPSSGIFRVAGGNLALYLRFIEKNSEY